MASKRIVSERYEVQSGWLARQMEEVKSERRIELMSCKSNIRRIHQLKNCRSISSDQMKLMHNMSRKKLFGLICISSTLLISVIILPTMSANAMNETLTMTTASSLPSSDTFNAANATTQPLLVITDKESPEVKLNVTLSGLENSTRASANMQDVSTSSPTQDKMDQNRDESVLHTITVNSTSFMPYEQPQTNSSQSENRNSEGFSNQVRSTRELTGDENTFKKRRFSRLNGSTKEGKIRRISSRRVSQKAMKEKGTSTNKLSMKDAEKTQSSSTKRPDMSHKSDKFLKFLKQIKNKRRLRNDLDRLDLPSASVKAPPPQLNSSASYIHEDWINYADASQPASEKVATNSKAAGFEPSKPRQQAAAAPNLADNKSSAVKGSTGGSAGSLPKRVAITKQTSSKENNKPVVTKTSTTTTTVGDGKKEAKVTSKSAALPPGLRQRIIEQFVKNGGDPQNIVVSDSTITTTSQSKKKTITTVYKIVPNKSPLNRTSFGQAKIIKPIMMSEPGEGIIGNKMGSPKFEIMQEDLGTFKGGLGEADGLWQGKKPQKLKKIMVTRTEVPQTLFMPAGEGAKMGEELGEFYQGPHETMFGLNEQPNELNPEQKRAIMNLDKMAENNFESMKPPKMKALEYEAEIGQVKGVGGGGVSLEALIDAIKPSLQLELQTVSAKGAGKSSSAHNDELFSSLSAHDGVHHQDIAGGKSYQQPANKHLLNFHELSLKSGAKSSGAHDGPARPKKAEQQVVPSVSTGRTASVRQSHQAEIERPASKKQQQQDQKRSSDGEGGDQAHQQRRRNEQAETAMRPDEDDLERNGGQQQRPAPADQQDDQGLDGQSDSAGGESDSEPENNAQVQPPVRKQTSEGERRESKKAAAEGDKAQSDGELRRVISAGSQLNRLKGLKKSASSTKPESGAASSSKRRSASQGSHLSFSKEDHSDNSTDGNRKHRPNKEVHDDELDDDDDGEQKQLVKQDTMRRPSKREKQAGATSKGEGKEEQANNDRAGERSQPAPTGEQSPGGPRQTKTHNIMMLIDFNPTQQAQLDGGGERSAAPNQLVSQGPSGRLQTSASDQVGGGGGQVVRQGSFAPVNRRPQENVGGWRPLEHGEASTGRGSSSRAGAQPKGGQRLSAPAVNVQIYNNHLLPSPQAIKESALSGGLSSDYGDGYAPSSDEHDHDGSGHYAHRLPLVSSSAPDHLESLYGDYGSSSSMGSFGGDGYDAAAASQQHSYKSLVLPNYTSTPEMAKPNPVPHMQQIKAPLGNPGQLQHYRVGAFSARPTRAPPTTNVASTTTTTTEEPIIPGESADTNRLVKQVINELAMSASGDQHHLTGNASNNHFYTTTSVHDLASANEDEEDLITSDHFEIKQPLAGEQQPLAATSAFELRRRMGQTT